MPTRRIVTCIWFDGDAERAAEFYVSLLPDSRIDRVCRSPIDTPGSATGEVLTVEFTLAGNRYLALNGGPGVAFNDAVSFQILCDDQAEVDRLWSRLTADGGEEVACSWLRDRWGLRWQIVPARLPELLNDPDPERARRAMEAMVQMVKIDIAALERAADGT